MSKQLVGSGSRETVDTCSGVDDTVAVGGQRQETATDTGRCSEQGLEQDPDLLGYPDRSAELVFLLPQLAMEDRDAPCVEVPALPDQEWDVSPAVVAACNGTAPVDHQTPSVDWHSNRFPC